MASDSAAPWEPGPTLAAMQVQAAMEGAQLCALGFHAWMPWLPIRAGDGLPTDRLLRYETFCSRCRTPEQFDV